jgi:hypothetical protein
LRREDRTELAPDRRGSRRNRTEALPRRPLDLVVSVSFIARRRDSIIASFVRRVP